MKIKRKELVRLIENYLLEDTDEEVEEEPADDEEAEEAEEAEEEPADEPEEDAADDESAEPEEASISASKVISNSLKKVSDFIKNKKPLSALQAVNDAAKNALNDIEVKSKDLPDEIKKLLGFENKSDEEVVNLSAAAKNSGRLRIAAAKESKNK